MYFNTTRWEVQFYLVLTQLPIYQRLQAIKNRDPTVWEQRAGKILREFLKLSLALGTLAWLYSLTWIERGGVVAMFVLVPAVHEWGHYREMMRHGIIPEKVGVGIPFWLFKHLQWKFHPRWLPCPVWISPLFVFLAYVDEGPPGSEARGRIEALPAEDQARIYGMGVLNNFLTGALSLGILIIFSRVDGINPVVAGLSVLFAIFMTVWLIKRFPFSIGGMVAFLFALLLSLVVYIWPSQGFESMNTTLLVIILTIAGAALKIYQGPMIRRIFPLVGWVAVGFFAYKIGPALITDFGYASANGAALHGETATVIGTRSLLELNSIETFGVSQHLRNLLGADMSSAFSILVQDWRFIPTMGLLASVGFGLTNLLPIEEVDGGHLWKLTVDPEGKRPIRRLVAIWLPTLVIVPPLLITFFRTEFGDVILWVALIIIGYYSLAKFVKWRLTLVVRSLRVRQRILALQGGEHHG